MNKKGDVTDIVFFGALVFLFAIGFAFFGNIFSTVTNAINQSSLNINETQTAINDLHYITTEGINQGYMFLFVGLVLAQFASAFLIRQHPFFIVLYFFSLLAGMTLAVVAGNSFDSIQSSLPSLSIEQPVISWVMDNILTIIIAVDLISVLLIFGKVGATRT